MESLQETSIEGTPKDSHLSPDDISLDARKQVSLPTKLDKINTYQVYRPLLSRSFALRKDGSGEIASAGESRSAGVNKGTGKSAPTGSNGKSAIQLKTSGDVVEVDAISVEEEEIHRQCEQAESLLDGNNRSTLDGNNSNVEMVSTTTSASGDASSAATLTSEAPGDDEAVDDDDHRGFKFATPLVIKSISSESAREGENCGDATNSDGSSSSCSEESVRTKDASTRQLLVRTTKSDSENSLKMKSAESLPLLAATTSTSGGNILNEEEFEFDYECYEESDHLLQEDSTEMEDVFEGDGEEEEDTEEEILEAGMTITQLRGNFNNNNEYSNESHFDHVWDEVSTNAPYSSKDSIALAVCHHSSRESAQELQLGTQDALDTRSNHETRSKSNENKGRDLKIKKK